MRQAPHLPNPGALPAVLIWGVVGLVTMAQSSHAMVQPQPWLIHEWMEEKDPNLPKELCSLSFVSLGIFLPVVLLSCAQRNLHDPHPREQSPVGHQGPGTRGREGKKTRVSRLYPKWVLAPFWAFSSPPNQPQRELAPLASLRQPQLIND